MKLWSDGTGRRVYLPLEEDIEATGIEEVEVYSLRNQNTIAQYIETQPILYLCLMA